jgi:hypothetical protein
MSTIVAGAMGLLVRTGGGRSAPVWVCNVLSRIEITSRFIDRWFLSARLRSLE